MAKASSVSADLSDQNPDNTPIVNASINLSNNKSKKTTRESSKNQSYGGKIPPQNIDAEMSLLGAILMDEEVMADIADKIHPNDFYDKRHSLIFDAILKLYQRHAPIDLLTLSHELRAAKLLKQVGGAQYIGDLTNYVPSSAHAEEYANIIVMAAVRRRLISAGSRISQLAFSEEEEVQSILSQAEADLYAVSESSEKSELVSLESILTESFDRMEDLHRNKDKLRGMRTGFKDLDRLTAGLQKSDLIVLAARPAMGKSTLAQNIAYNVATREKKSVLIFNLEMSNSQTVDRMVAEAAGVDSWNIRTGKLTEEDFAKISEAMGEMAEAPIFFSDRPGLSVLEMKTLAQRQAHKTPLGLIIVDYLQLMSGSKNYGDNRVQEVSEISRGLKLVARELDVPVLALSQLSRTVESRPDKKPMLSDLRESGSIEQDADLVMFIYREDYYNPDTERQHITDLIISKHRNGPTGQIELYFHPDRLKFMSLEKRQS